MAVTLAKNEKSLAAWARLLSNPNRSREFGTLGPRLGALLLSAAEKLGQEAVVRAIDRPSEPGIQRELASVLAQVENPEIAEELAEKAAPEIARAQARNAARTWSWWEKADKRLIMPVRATIFRLVADAWSGAEGDSAPSSEELIKALDEDPFLLAQVRPEDAGLDMADVSWLKLMIRLEAKKKGDRGDREIRLVRAALVVAVARARERGHTSLRLFAEKEGAPAYAIGSVAVKLLRDLGLLPHGEERLRALVRQAAAELSNMAGRKKGKLLYPWTVNLTVSPDTGNGWMAPSADRFSEVAVMKAALGRLDMPEFKLPRAWKDVLAEEAPNLDKGQKEALEAAWRNPLTVLVGPAGSGKTEVLAALKRMRDRLEPKSPFIAAAFTGKAATLLTDRLGLDEKERAQTLHRSMRLAHEGAPVRYGQLKGEAEGGFVVVDESSLLPSYLLGKLVIALSDPPVDAKGGKDALFQVRSRLVLAGDESQLAPVGSGDPFRDLLEALRFAQGGGFLPYNPVVELSQNHRQTGQALALSADLLRHGSFKGWQPGQLEGKKADDESAAADLVVRFSKEADRERKSWQVLTRTREDATWLNGILRKARGLPEEGGFVVGDRVMQIRNDYETGLMNGEQGTVLSISGGSIKARFPRGDVEIPLWKAFGEWDLAWAITVHKAQGSEWDRVALVERPGSRKMRVNTAFGYTALTRGREMCVVISPDPEDLMLRMARLKPEKRVTSLRGLLVKRFREMAPEPHGPVEGGI